MGQKSRRPEWLLRSPAKGRTAKGQNFVKASYRPTRPSASWGHACCVYIYILYMFLYVPTHPIYKASSSILFEIPLCFRIDYEPLLSCSPLDNSQVKNPHRQNYYVNGPSRLKIILCSRQRSSNNVTAISYIMIYVHIIYNLYIICTCSEPMIII